MLIRASILSALFIIGRFLQQPGRLDLPLVNKSDKRFLSVVNPVDQLAYFAWCVLVLSGHAHELTRVLDPHSLDIDLHPFILKLPPPPHRAMFNDPQHEVFDVSDDLANPCEVLESGRPVLDLAHCKRSVWIQQLSNSSKFDSAQGWKLDRGRPSWEQHERQQVSLSPRTHTSQFEELEHQVIEFTRFFSNDLQDKPHAIQVIEVRERGSHVLGRPVSINVETKRATDLIHSSALHSVEREALYGFALRTPGGAP